MNATSPDITESSRRGRHRKPSAEAEPVEGDIRVRIPASFILTVLLLAALAYWGFGNRSDRVAGVEDGSIAPHMDRGDIASVGRPNEVEVGDIGVFVVDGRIVTGRIVDIDEDGSYVTQPESGSVEPVPDSSRERQSLEDPYLLGSVFGEDIGANMTESEDLSAEAGVLSGTDD